MNDKLKNRIKRGLKYGAITIGTIALLRSYYILDQTEQAVITVFGDKTRVILNPVEKDEAQKKEKIDRITSEIQNYCKMKNLDMPSIQEDAGFKLKWPWEAVTHYDRRLLEWDGYPEQVTTKDKKYLFADATGRWYIDNPYIFMATLTNESAAHNKLDAVVDGVVRDFISNRDAIESIRTSNRKMQVTDKELENTVRVDSIYSGRKEMMNDITKKVEQQMHTYGIAFHDFQMKGLIYVNEVKVNVEKEMIAERNRISEKYLSEGEGEFQKIMGEKEREYKRIMSEAYMRSQEIRGMADKKATKIYGEAYNLDPEFYRYITSLQVMKNNAEGVTYIIDKNNPLFKYLSENPTK